MDTDKLYLVIAILFQTAITIYVFIYLKKQVGWKIKLINLSMKDCVRMLNILIKESNAKEEANKNSETK